MSAFFQALQQGYTPQQVLQYLSKAIPQFSPSIKKATRAGYGPQQILGFLSKNFDTENRSGMSESERHASNRRADTERTKYGLKAAGAAIAAPLAAYAARGALARALPSSLQGLIPGGAGGSPNPSTPTSPNAMNPSGSALAPMLQAPQAQNPQSPASLQPPVSPNIPQQAPPIQPQVNTTNLKDIFSKYKGFTNKIDELLSAKNNPEAITTYFRQYAPGQSAKLEKESGKPLEEIISEYLASKPPISSQPKPSPSSPPNVPTSAAALTLPQSPISKQMDENVNPLDIEKPVEKAEALPIQEKVSPEMEKDEEKAPVSITKGSVAISPQGVGEVKEIRNGKAIIEVDGKKHAIAEEDLEPPSFTDNEIADAYEDLFNKIPEPYRSGFISWAGYDEERNVLGFIPRGGKYEELENITPEEAEKIKEGRGVARTSGEEREGLWVKGEPTRGGVISQIIHDRKNKHKEGQERQLEIPLDVAKGEKEDKGMKPLFDEMAHARNLSRERDKKKRDEERAQKKREKEQEKARLKKEKDEAKKRKKQA